MKTADLKEAIKVLYPVAGGNGNISFGEWYARVIGDSVRVDLLFGSGFEEEVDTVTVNARSLRDTVKKIDAEDIEIEVDDGRAVLKAGRMRSKMVPRDVDVSPLTMDADDVTVDLTRDDLVLLLDRVRYAAAAGDDAKPVLKAVHLHTDGDNLVSVATNGHRLARYAVKAGVRDEIAITVPMDAVEAILSFLASHGKKNNCHVDLVVGAGKGMVRTDRGAVTFTLIEGEYPDYQRVIPEVTHFVDLDATKFSAALDRLMVTAPKENNFVRAYFSGDEVQLISRIPDFEGEEIIEIEGISDLHECGFNASYMMDAIRDGKIECRIAFNAKGPIRIDGLVDKNYTAVVMPIRLDG